MSGEEMVYEGEVETRGEEAAQKYKDLPKDFNCIRPFV